MNRPLEHLSVVVAGAAGGIGSAAVQRLLNEGAQVAGVDIDAADIHRDAHGIAADLTEPGAVEDALAAAEAAIGPIDSVVNAVGASGRRLGDGPVDQIPDEAWRWTLSVNLDTTFHLCRAAVPVLRRRGQGSIINVSSVLGLGGDHQFATHAYAASKGAVIALSRSMAVAYAPERIRVNVVCPGLIETPMSGRAGRDEATLARLAELQPLTGTMGQPDDVAGAISYLVSPAAAFVTGIVLPVDGGWTAR